MPDKLQQVMLDRASVDKGNADIAKLQQLAQAQQAGGGQGLIQKIMEMIRGPQAAPPPMSFTETQNMPDVNLPNEQAEMPNDPRLAEMADRKKYIGMRAYPAVSLGK